MPLLQDLGLVWRVAKDTNEVSKESSHLFEVQH